MTIQWFPGHMTRAKREMQEKLSMVDMVIECRDARLPMSSENPMVNELTQSKPKLIVLTKKDISDDKQVALWADVLRNDHTQVIVLDLIHDDTRNRVVDACLKLMEPKFQRWLSKGIQPRKIKAMVVGIPNVGKSTLINQLAKKKLMVTADRPGVTMSLKWANVHPKLDVLDTPGVLWPKFDDPEVGKRLAWAGSIAEKVLPIEVLALEGFKYLESYYPKLLADHYGLDFKTFDEFIYALAQKRHLVKGDELRILDAIQLFLNDLKHGHIGALCFEQVPHVA